MTIQQLIYFREIALTKNYTQAAANLYVAQPSISHAIQKLEEELNVPLFLRQPNKSIELTMYGKALLPVAEKILTTMNEGTAEIARLRNPYSGIVRIGCAFGSSYEIFMQILHNFHKAEHSNDIILRPVIIHDAMNFLSMLSSGDIDLLLAVNISDTHIQSTPLCYEELIVYIPNSNPLSKKSFVTLNDLKQETLLIPSATYSLQKYILQMYKMEGFTPQFSMLDGEFDNWAVVLSALVYEREKICIFPKLPLKFNNITPVPLVHRMNRRPINIAWATNRELSTATRYVKDWCLDFCREYYS